MRRIELLDCQLYVVQFTGDADKMQDLLPSGYEPRPEAGRIQNVGLDSYHCGSAVIDNTTVVKTVKLYGVSAAAGVPQEVQSQAAGNYYAYEQVVSNPIIAEAFRGNGFHVVTGESSFTTMAQSIEGTFTQDGATVYEYSGAGELGNGTVPNGVSARIHQSDGTNRTWFDVHQDLVSSQVGEVGLLSATAGIVSQMFVAPTGMSPATSGISWTNLVITFRPEE